MNYSILNLAAEMGGMQKTIIGIFGIIGVYINSQLINSKMIRELYFKPNLKKEDKVDDTFTDKTQSCLAH